MRLGMQSAFLDSGSAAKALRRIRLILAIFALWLGPGIARANTAVANYEHYTDERGILHVTSRRIEVQTHLKPSLLTPETKTDFLTGSGTNFMAVSEPRTSSRFDHWILGAAHLYQLPEPLIRAVIHTESRFNPRAVSSVGATGLMQLMPKTAQFLGVQDAFDPRQNIYGGSKYLRLLANMFHGDMVLVVAAYFSGAGSVKKYGGVPPYAKVRRYVKAVLQRYYFYERQAIALSTSRALARQIAGGNK